MLFRSDKKLIEKTFSEKDKKDIIIKLAKGKNELSISSLAEKNAKQALKQKLVQSDTNNNLIEELASKFNINNNQNSIYHQHESICFRNLCPSPTRGRPRYVRAE